MRLIDSHAHYNDPKFEDYPGGAAAALSDSFDSGVCGIICAGTSPETSDECISLAESNFRIWAAAGLHPSDLRFFPEGEDDEAVSLIKKKLSHPRVCALGEIGLDYHYGGEDRERQKRVFDAQLLVSEEMGLPVIVHDRDAHGDTLDIIRAHPNAFGVMHSFSGSAEMAAELVKLGWYISFSGTITYKNARNIRRAAAAVPHERILVETDAPYLPPSPHRGEINVSAYLGYTAASAAEAVGMDVESFCELTVENTERLFRIACP